MNEFIVKPVPLDDLWAAVAGGAPAGPVAAGFDPSPALSRELHAAFARELPGKRAELAAAVNAADWARVRATAHYLRNSALVVRADALFAACTGLEEAAAAGREAEVRLWWPRCARLLDAAAGS
jgi:HPt (histidine-containing phosphotransfer) domain-containing protein